MATTDLKGLKQVPASMSGSQAGELVEVLREEFPHIDGEALGARSGVGRHWRLQAAQLGQADFFRLLQALHDSEAPNIALRVANHIRLESLGVMGYAVLACATLEQGLHLCSQFIEHSYPFIRIALEATPDYAVLSCSLLPGGLNHGQLLQELWLVSVWNYIRELLPDGVAACASFAQLNYPAPSYHWQYQQLLGCRVEFQRDQTVLAIPRQWLYIPVQRGSRQAQSLYEHQVLRILREQGYQGDIVNRVKRLLLERPADCDYSLEQTAPLLSLSSRTLRRYLAEAGTTFRQVCLEVRMSLARDYLLYSRLTAQEIAFQLGYSQPNNFYRAFKQVHGEPPERFRQTNLPVARMS